MQLHFGTELLHPEWNRAVACVGTFDGVHLGHREVIRRAVETAQSAELPCVLVTFDRHPAAVLAPERCPLPISPIDQNLAIFASLGVAIAVVLHFDAELSRMSARRFLDDVLRGSCRAERLVVGHDFAMGQNREGDTAWLGQHIETEVIPPFEIAGKRVSSSEIRRQIAAGEMEQAARLLGRPFAISGVVVAGQKLGRDLGYPTVNLARSASQVGPPDGIYAGQVEIDGQTFKAAVSIGNRPTVGGEHRTVEAYLLDYDGGSLYGRSLRLELKHRLRDELAFPDLHSLTRQIAADVEMVRERLT